MCPIAPCQSSGVSSSLTTWPKTWEERTKRMYSLNLRSSACARRESCNKRLSGKRSFSSSVHLSAINHPEKNPARARGPAGSEKPACGGLEGDKRAEIPDMRQFSFHTSLTIEGNPHETHHHARRRHSPGLRADTSACTSSPPRSGRDRGAGDSVYANPRRSAWFRGHDCGLVTSIAAPGKSDSAERDSSDCSRDRQRPANDWISSRRILTVESRMSGGLLVRLRAKDIRSQQTKKHQARLRNSIFSPTGNRPRFYSAKPGHFIGSTKRIDDLVRVHLRIVRHTLRDCKPYLINNSLGLPNDHMA